MHSALLRNDLKFWVVVSSSHTLFRLCLARLDCPQNWVLHGKSCYYVIGTPTTKWSDARTKCQNRAGDLAIIRSEDENKFVLNLLKNQKTVQIEGAWLGLKRNTSAGNKFYWIDGTPLAGQYSAWASGQPSNPYEQCVQIYAASYKPGVWNDKECVFHISRESTAPVVLCQQRLMPWRGDQLVKRPRKNLFFRL